MLCTVSDDAMVNLWSLENERPESHFTLRGHKGPVYAVTGASENDKLIFTAGAEGLIKIWMIPEFEKGERAPSTSGRSFCVGEWKSSANPTTEDSYIALSYAPMQNYFLAAKLGGSVELWDCKEQLKKAANYD